MHYGARLARYAWIGLALLAGCAGLEKQNSEGSPLPLIPHVGQWQQDGDAWATAGGAASDGWYLRSPRQYDLRQVSFRVRKDNDDGYIFVYLKDWQVELGSDHLTARYTGFWGPGKPPYRLWNIYFYTATRPIAFAPGRWHDFALSLDGAFLRVAWDGVEVLKWNSPKDEWLAKVQKSGRFRSAEHFIYPERLDADALAGKKQVVVLHAYNTPARFENVRIDGTDAGPAEGFVDPNAAPIPPFVRPDSEFARLAPAAPVAPRNILDAAELAKAASLPPVESWKFTQKHPDWVNPPKYFGDENKNAVKVAEYRVGAAAPGKFPGALHLFWSSLMYGASHMPQELRLYFNLKQAGEYTLELDTGPGMGWGPNELEMRVDGTPVSREVYRALAQGGHCAPIEHWTPLILAAGPHRVDIALTETLVKTRYFMMKHTRLPLNGLALEPGIHEPEFVRTVGKVTVDGQKPEALAAPATMGEQAGQTLRYRFAGLEAGRPYRVKLSFFEVDVNRPGERLMDIFVNGQQVAKDLDIVKEYGWVTPTERPYETQAGPDGAITLRLVGKNFKAFVNALAITDAEGREVYRENCGWTPAYALRIKRVSSYRPGSDTQQLIVEPLPPAPDQFFDGHNLVANPHFTLAEKDGHPMGWYSCLEMRRKTTARYLPDQLEVQSPALADVLRRKGEQPNVLAFFNILQGDGEYRHDPAVGHEQPGALRVGKTGKDFALACNWPPVDFHKTQRFSFYARTDHAAGQVWAEVLWFAVDMNASSFKWRDWSLEGGPLAMPRLQLMRRDSSKVRLTGTTDWTRIEVTAKPPFGALYALLTVRVENNSDGAAWIDDAEFDGYGVEPLEIEMSLLGFHPKSDKQAVIKSMTNAPVRWELRDADGKVMRSGDAVYHNYEWYSRRHYYTVDLTAFETAGRYRLFATQGDATASTPEFPINAGVYRDLARVALHGLYFMRMNGDIPGVHGPEALEDAHMLIPYPDYRFNVYEKKFFPDRPDLVGGYFDAGDEIKHAEFWPAVILACWNIRQYIRPALADRGADDGWDELRYALDSFLRYQLPNGSFVLNVKPYVSGSDNVPYYSNDRYVQDTFPGVQAAGICAMAAWVLRNADAPLSARSLSAAERSYRFNALWDVAAAATDARQRLYSASKAFWAEMYLAKLRPEEAVYRERMDRHAALVAQGLKNGDYRGTSEMYNAYNSPACLLQDCVWVSCLFLQEYPDHPAAPALREGLLTFVADVRQASAIDPWGEARALAAPMKGRGLPNRFPGDWGGVGYWPMLSFSLAEIGLTLHDADIIRLAERQLQWMLGKNFGGVCGIHGVSDRVTAAGSMFWLRDRYVEGWMNSTRKLYTFDGAVPKTFMRGLPIPGGNRPNPWTAEDSYVPQYYMLPDGFCAVMPQADYPVHPGMAEPGLSQMALFTIPVPLIHAALESLNNK